MHVLVSEGAAQQTGRLALVASRQLQL